MSYKILIADDEPLVLVGLQSIIDWESLGLTIAGVARNGEQLMTQIEETGADLVLTDIRMPVRSGLEVMRECAERFGRLPLFIILTSHEEYAYVKEAIQGQAVNYLVKLELSPETLTAALRRALDMLRDIKGVEPKAADSPTQMRPFVDKFLVRLLNGLFETQAQYLKQREDLGVHLEGEVYFAAYCGVEGIEGKNLSPEKQLSLYSSTLSIVRESLVQHMDCHTVSLDLRHFCVIFSLGEDAPEIGGPRDRISEALAHAVGLVHSYFALSLRIAVGRPVREAFSLHESFDSARRAYARISAEDQGILFDDDAGAEVAEGCGAFDMASFRDALSLAFQELDMAALAAILDRILARLAGADHACAMDAACGILYMALSLLPDGEESISGIFGGERYGYRILYEYTRADQCVAWIATLRDGLLNCLSSRKQDYRTKVIAKVQRYIDENVGKRLLLSEVASVHGLSQNYLSALFSRYGGCSFVEYTTRAKVSAAKRLMASGDLKIHEIADRLGFESAFYFSKVFKKVEGLSPREYMQQLE